MVSKATALQDFKISYPDVLSALLTFYIHHNSICLKVLGILAYANLTVIETDGPYGGYTCSSTNHAHHEGIKTSFIF